MKQPRDRERRAAISRARRRRWSSRPGQTRKETEGVFVIRDGRAEFVPIKIGIAGDRYFEVLSGIKAGDQVITGPYSSVRGMARRRPGSSADGAGRQSQRHRRILNAR